MQIIIAILLGIKRNGHIFIGLLLGIIIGCFFPNEQYPRAYGVLNFVAQSFIDIIQMVVLPLVVSAIIIGISNIGDSKQLTKFGTKMIFYYAILSLILTFRFVFCILSLKSTWEEY
jgi:Na+/H+-dicarboxylate symporter